MANLKGISIVIPNYNGQDLLPQILPLAITALENTGLPFQIIVSDDASTDGSVSSVKKHFPEVLCLTAEKNSGFSVTANRGIKAAVYDWVLLLNSDVKLTPNYFEHLIPYTERNDILGVMGRIVGWDDDIIQDGAKYPLWQGAKIKTSWNYIAKEETDNNSLQVSKKINPLPSFYLSGANSFLNKKVFEHIGGFNELFSPYYVEDTELGLRAWRLGYSCLYEHRAVCRHRTSTTISTNSNKKKVDIIYNRNKMFFHAIHLDGMQLIAWYSQYKLEMLFKLLLLQPGLLQSFFAFWKNVGQVVAYRKKIKSIGKIISVNQVFEKITGTLDPDKIQKFKS